MEEKLNIIYVFTLHMTVYDKTTQYTNNTIWFIQSAFAPIGSTGWYV